MKRLIFLLVAFFLVVLMVKFPNETVNSQTKRGSIKGIVIARDKGNGKTSVSVAVENNCPKNETCDKQRIGNVIVTIDDKRLKDNQLPDGSLGDNQKGIPDAVKKNLDDWKVGVDYQLWMRPNNNKVEEVKSSEFATDWDGKWNEKTETQKNEMTYTFSDKDAATSEFGFYLKIDYNVPIEYVLKEKFEVKVTYEDKTLFEEELKPYQLPPLDNITPTASNCLTAPYSYNPGKDSFGTLHLNEFGKTYKNNYYNEEALRYYGEFTPPIGYGAFLQDKNAGNPRWIPAPDLIDDQPSMTDQYFKINTPETAQPKDTIVIIGVNIFGEVVYVFELKEVWVLPDGEVSTCKPGISQVPKYVFEGRRLCVCGCYTENDELDLEDGETVFTLDGKPIAPQAMSATTATFIIPEGTTPGVHQIGYVSPFGDRTLQTLEFNVLKLVGKIDTTVIQRGGTTDMTLRILGTSDVFPLKITNATPEIIGVEGGIVQVAPTSGGTDNSVVRKVTGVKVGNFTILYEVDQPPCPCLDPLEPAFLGRK
jgi:hypothetical protein